MSQPFYGSWFLFNKTSTQWSQCLYQTLPEFLGQQEVNNWVITRRCFSKQRRYSGNQRGNVLRHPYYCVQRDNGVRCPCKQEAKWHHKCHACGFPLCTNGFHSRSSVLAPHAMRISSHFPHIEVNQRIRSDHGNDGDKKEEQKYTSYKNNVMWVGRLPANWTIYACAFRNVRWPTKQWKKAPE